MDAIKSVLRNVAVSCKWRSICNKEAPVSVIHSGMVSGPPWVIITYSLITYYNLNHGLHHTWNREKLLTYGKNIMCGSLESFIFSLSMPFVIAVKLKVFINVKRF